MAALHGRSGVIQIDTVGVGELTEWSISTTTPEVNVTAMGASTAAYVAGLEDASVSISCNWDPSDAGQEDIRDGLAAGTAITVNIYPSGSTTSGADYYTGSVTITTSEVSATVDGAITCSFGGRGGMTLGTVT